MDPDSFTTMPFGKHRGRFIRDVPARYLDWVLANVTDLNPRLRNVIAESLRRRRGGRGPAAAPGPAPGEYGVDTVPRDRIRGIVRDWYRQLAFEYHHDRGNDQRIMAALNVARDRLIVALSLD